MSPIANLEYLAEWRIFECRRAQDRRQGYRLACRLAGSSSRMAFLKGMAELRGLGIKKNIACAVKSFSKAVEMGDCYAPTLLGYLYDRGIGVVRDEGVAFGFYKMGASRGDFEAMANLAACYEDGLGVTKNKNIARQWRKRAKIANKCLAQRLARSAFRF